LLQRISPELAQRLRRFLFDQMIAATEGDRAAEAATREFREYLPEELRSAHRGKPE